MIQANESRRREYETETCEHGERACEVCNDRRQQVQGSPRYCGDGQPYDNEACDDGNNIEGDGCSADCERVEEGDAPDTLMATQSLRRYQ